MGLSGCVVWTYDSVVADSSRRSLELVESRLTNDVTEVKSEVGDRNWYREICSEYVWECYRTPGINIEYDRRGFIAPADFARVEGMELRAVLRA